MSLTDRNTWSLVLLVFVTVSQVADVTDNYPDIKWRRQGYGRHPDEDDVPSIFVLDTNEPETGSWGPWSSASSCSRSCGGGVAHQTRECFDVDDSGDKTCAGAKKRFFSCNIQECPSGSADFWAEQCSKFNDIEFEGIYYDWIPYTGGPNKCELNCMPRGDHFVYRPKFVVTDGTPCDSEKNDVCVEGKCMPVGCDKMLGSDAREDACRECGGDGSNCDTVNGIFDIDDLQVGDVDILLIPQGATNIVVKELSPSSNYLAIRNTTGYYYLYGNWRIDFPLHLRFANTIFHYATDLQGFSAVDTITALGPTSEAIYVVLLYQDRNVGVHYEYSVPKKFSEQSDPDSYTWATDEFSECSTSCGGGYKSRLVKCVRRRDNKPADETFCDPQLEPDAKQDCGSEPCPSERFAGGGRTRQIKCEEIPAGVIPSIFDDALCLKTVGPKNDPSEKWKPEGKLPVISWTKETREHKSPTSSFTDSPIDEDCANSNAGCKTLCENSTYGCCEDNSTPAHGPNQEGCCLASTFGCCPDSSSPARGPNNEGCGCQFTPHGCCPNGFTPANGPDFEGCACNTYQFGCCSDGVAIAKGPNGQGCACENTEFKCCSDERTAAKGPNFAGCKCDASKFGCCPDGVEEAQGENFEGCLRVPKNPGAICGLKNDRGSCTDYTIRWYFDTNYGSCSRFWYGGCKGNDNRFQTLEECKDVCVQPKGKGACYLPKVSGPCEGFDPKWFYDSEKKQCTQFVYTGCLGNNNRFETREDCEELCSVSTDIEQDCLLPPLPGECSDYETRWFYDSPKQLCMQFYYGGCGGNGNNFATEEDCAGRCKKSASILPSPATEFGTAPTTLAPDFDTTAPPFVAIKQPEESRVSAEEGSFVTLTCAATGNPKPTIVWRINSTAINPSEARRRILPDGSLQIVNLYDYDRGTYVCSAHNGLAPPARMEYQLEVKEPHKRTAAIIGEPNTFVTVRMSSPVMLHCYAMGWPRPSVTWWRGDRMLALASENHEHGLDHTLLIRSVTPTDLGVYTCQAYNGLKKPVSWSVMLRADQAPVNVYVTAKTTNHSLGSNISIGCAVDGFPIPTVFWYKNNERVRTDDRIQISESNGLLISNATRDDTGTYRCEAANEYSSNFGSIDIRTDGLNIHPDCQDNNYLTKCKLIVINKYCHHRYYKKFCCRSCTEAGQLPLSGPHLDAKQRRRKSSVHRRFV